MRSDVQYAPTPFAARRRLGDLFRLGSLDGFLAHLDGRQDTESAVIDGIQAGPTLRVGRRRPEGWLHVRWCWPHADFSLGEDGGQGAPEHTIDAGESDNVTQRWRTFWDVKAGRHAGQPLDEKKIIEFMRDNFNKAYGKY